MIVCTDGSIEIKGRPTQVAAEFSSICRAVKEALCENYGDEIGYGIFEESIKLSLLNSKEIEEKHRMSQLMLMLMMGDK